MLTCLSLPPSLPYQPRHAGPGDVLYDLVDEHLEAFLAASRDRGRPLWEWVEEAFRKYLCCGRPEFGFTWYQCEDCGHDLVLGFSCKERTLCPSCGGRRMNQFAANLVDRVIPEVPVRHWVLSFPFRPRFLLARHPDLRNEVLGIFHDEVQIWLREATGEPTGKGGAVSVWQMAGSTMNLNPHIHSIILDGQYVRDDATGDLVFRRARRPPARRLQELVERVRLRVERLLVARGFDEDTQCDEEDGLLPLHVAAVEGRGVKRRRGNASSRQTQKDGAAWSEWFDLHAGSSIEGEDREQIERLARYIARPPFSVKHLSRRADGHVVLTLHHAWRDGTTCVEFDPMTFLGRLAAIVPHPRIHLTHYHGVLAPASAWRREVVPDAPEARRSSWIPWASLLERVFGVNPLVCSICGGKMVVRAVVERMGTAKKLLGVIAARVQAFTLLPFPLHTSSLALGP